MTPPPTDTRQVTADVAGGSATVAHDGRERSDIAAIEHALADMRAGRVVTHEDAMTRLEAIIDQVG